MDEKLESGAPHDNPPLIADEGQDLEHPPARKDLLPSRKDLLSELQADLANQKLEAEIAKLRKEAEPEKWWAAIAKRFVAVGALVTVIATIFGIWDSYDKTLTERERA